VFLADGGRKLKMIRDMTYGGVKMPDVRVVHGSNMILLTDWHIEGMLPDGRVLYLDVKAGFRFDGASIPRILWRVCGHPLEAPRIAAALAHDWIYASKSASRADADLIYRIVCAWVGIRPFCRNVEYVALRLCGWVAWRGHTVGDRVFAQAHGALELGDTNTKEKTHE